MTRFARAKGSKASNERAPEDGTPWEVMKEQLLQAKKENEESEKRKEAEKQRIENYENFLKDQKVLKRKATWCDFPELPNKKINNTAESNGVPGKKKNKNKKNVSNEQEITESVNGNNSCHDDHNEGLSKKSKKKKKKTNVTDNTPNMHFSMNEDQTDQNKKGNKKKNKKQNSMKSNINLSENSNINNTITSVNEEPNNTLLTNESNKKKNKKINNMKLNKNSTDNPNQNDTTQSVNEESNSNAQKPFNNVAKPNNKAAQRKKNKKLVDGKPVRRKEIDDRSFQLIINGKEIELVRYDGFPVMKKDAERLEELKTSMIKKGIPKSEVQRTMKLERRRAEKALARMKREVCYNCRKGGHVLSDCPELKSKIPGADSAEGVCFKCGSTEHRQFECKVQKDKEFRFATCFICKEPGHIARQCPDNPKGLYPNGGCCKLCGDVTHLRKDCPTVMDKKEESTVKLHTIGNSDNIEDVAPQTKVTTAEPSKKPKKIKF